MRKIPASHVPAEAVQYEREPEIVSEPTAHVTSGLEWAMPTSCSKPAWALHFVRVLQRLGHLRQMQGKPLDFISLVWLLWHQLGAVRLEGGQRTHARDGHGRAISLVLHM